MKEKRKMLAISPEAYENLKSGAEKSKTSLYDLLNALITKEINWLNDPVKIAEYFKMCKDGK